MASCTPHSCGQEVGRTNWFAENLATPGGVEQTAESVRLVMGPASHNLTWLVQSPARRAGARASRAGFVNFKTPAATPRSQTSFMCLCWIKKGEVANITGVWVELQYPQTLDKCKPPKTCRQHLAPLPRPWLSVARRCVDGDARRPLVTWFVRGLGSGVFCYRDSDSFDSPMIPSGAVATLVSGLGSHTL